jgi:hypothetical protein
MMSHALRDWRNPIGSDGVRSTVRPAPRSTISTRGPRRRIPVVRRARRSDNGAYTVRMIAFIILLLVVWAVLAILGFVIKGLFWLAIIGILLFIITGIIGFIRRNVGGNRS